MSFTVKAGALVALAALSALILPAWLALSAALVVVVAALVDSWLARETPEAVREAPRILSRGVPGQLTVVSGDPRVRIRQGSVPDLEIEPAESSRRLAAEVVARRRGRHRLPPVGSRTTGPLGLGCWYHLVGGETEVVVYPDLPAARRLAVAVRTGRFSEEGRRSRGPIGLGTEFERIRDYLPDDDIRQVNWRATARRGTPMSNQWRVEQDRELICLIDCGRLMGAAVRDRTRLDAAVDAVAALAAVADEIGDRIGVVAFDSAIRRRLAPRRGGAEAVLAATFDLEPSSEESDYALAFHTVASAKRSMILVFTDLIEESAARPLLEAMSVLSHHHHVVVASVLDDDLTAEVERPSSSIADVYRTVAALTVLNDRATVVGQLARRGAEVVEAGVESLSSRCVGAYLRARNRARI